MGDGTFGVNAAITREQLATMIDRYAVFQGMDTSSSASTPQFSDYAKVSSWAQSSLGWANEAGLIKGYEDGTLRPAGTATRAEFAQILTNFMKLR